VVYDGEPEVESDLRRRAAWLLVMLAVVAILFIVVVTALASTDGGGKDADGPGPLDNAISSSHSRTSASHHKPTKTSTAHSTHSSAPATGQTKCPTSQTCILAGDIGNGIQAVNDYRMQHGHPAVPGEVSAEAQTCAVHNGNGCSGGWSETELATPDGAEAVQKILKFAKLLDPHLTTFEVGWAYDPGAKLYYFAIIRND
jgi:hypothetical protein